LAFNRSEMKLNYRITIDKIHKIYK